MKKKNENINADQYTDVKLVVQMWVNICIDFAEIDCMKIGEKSKRMLQNK